MLLSFKTNVAWMQERKGYTFLWGKRLSYTHISFAKQYLKYVLWKDWCWSWNSNALATWCEELTLLKRLWCWKWLRAGREGDDREWDGWMESSTQWKWVWVDSRSWWWTGRPGVLWFMGLQRVGYDWATELNWTSHVKKIHPTLCYVMLQCLSVDGPTSHSMTMGLTMWLTVLYIHLRGFNILCALNWTLLPRSMKRKENMKIQQKEIFRCILDYLTLN